MMSDTRIIPKTMKAVGLFECLPLNDPNSFQDLIINVPEVKENQVLVEVKAIAINPVDAKIRKMPMIGTKPRILGKDGSGIVVSKGAGASSYNVGDEVIFIADTRQTGTNGQYVAVEEYTVGPKPKNLSFEESAAMTFAVATAYDCLYDRLGMRKEDAGKSFLIINSGGGVGSAASQLANNLGLKVIGTTSRKETEEFSKKNGAHIVLNHSQDLLPQLAAAGYPGGVDFLLINFDPFRYWDVAMKALKPYGRLCVLVDSTGLIDIKPLKEKSLTLASQNMATRILFNTNDKIRYQEILNDISRMLDNGQLKSTLTKVLSPINAANIREAHQLLEDKSIIGKLVVSGF